MKRLSSGGRLLGVAFLLLALFTSCNDEPTMYKPESVEDQMHVTPSVEEAVLSYANAWENAVTFTWNKAQNRPYNSKIVYYIQLFEQGSSTISSDLIELGENVTSYSITQSELNSIITKWGFSAGTSVPVDVKVIAKAENDEKFLMPEVSTCTFKATAYDTNIPLYIVWEVNGMQKSAKMKSVVSGEQYSYGGVLPKCEFYLTFDPTTNETSFGRSSDTLMEKFSGVPTNKFTVSDLSYVFVQTNIHTMKYSIEVDE